MSDNKIIIEKTEKGYSIKESGFLPGSFLTAFNGYIINKNGINLVCLECTYIDTWRAGSREKEIEETIISCNSEEKTAKDILLQSIREKANEFTKIRGAGYTLTDLTQQ